MYKIRVKMQIYIDEYTFDNKLFIKKTEVLNKNIKGLR